MPQLSCCYLQLIVLISGIGLSNKGIAEQSAHIYSPVQVVTEIFPPYQMLDAEGVLTGKSVLRVKQLFRQAGLASQISVLPWPRALKMASDTPDTLIFSLLKIPERQADFYWLLPLCKLTVSFYTAANRQDVVASQFTELRRYIVGAELGQANNLFLKQHGFRESKNLQLVGQNHQLLQMLALKRVDVLVLSDLYVAQQQLLTSTTEVPLRKLFAVPELSHWLYLAANRQSSATLLSRLTAAASQLPPPSDTECQPEQL